MPSSSPSPLRTAPRRRVLWAALIACGLVGVSIAMYWLIVSAPTAPANWTPTFLSSYGPSDFTPSTGATTGPGERGPWSNRILLATSADGKTFSSLGTLVGDQFDVPDLLVLPDGTLALYAIAWTAGSRSNALVVALSANNGDDWIYRYVDLPLPSSLPRGPSPADPDVVLLEDGTVRMYFTYDAKTHYADSTDGIAFTYGGKAFDGSGKMVLDPNVVRIGDTWHLYAGGGTGGNWHAKSANGTNFTAAASVTARGTDGLSYMISNALTTKEYTSVYGFANEGTDIQRFTTTDGTTFVAQGVALAYDAEEPLESEHVKDASVIRLTDGTYLMAYVTAIP